MYIVSGTTAIVMIFMIILTNYKHGCISHSISNRINGGEAVLLTIVVMLIVLEFVKVEEISAVLVMIYMEILKNYNYGCISGRVNESEAVIVTTTVIPLTVKLVEVEEDILEVIVLMLMKVSLLRNHTYVWLYN